MESLLLLGSGDILVVPGTFVIKVRKCPSILMMTENKSIQILSLSPSPAYVLHMREKTKLEKKESSAI
jgi:hypothetical protein